MKFPMAKSLMLFIKKPTIKECMNRFLSAIFFSLFSFSFIFAADTVYTIQKGDTVYGLSKKYRIPPSVLMAHNNISDPSKIKIGQKIIIPNTYIVQKGDTLYSIARASGCSIDELRKLNGLSAQSIIRPGDILIVQKNNSSKTVVASAPSKAESNKKNEPPVIPLQDPRNYTNIKIDTSLLWPVETKKISYLNGKLYGVVLEAKKGEQAKAIASGTVVYGGNHRGYGQVVFIQSKANYVYVYGGLESIAVSAGAPIKVGQSIGTVGSDAISKKSLLYFMVYNKNKPIDPVKAPRGI
ncbi:LysM peptidoglycan-binding domain-containing protein [Treponema phagedenis]|uniref:LysM peptidoglycan-binding domain-containing protein n=2 Tax=Treponema phagedenis TaxID=162 RepID=UPI0002F67776|nr:LysM peptidoglycan-binding domain-containing protein [Treponema phagedenis]